MMQDPSEFIGTQGKVYTKPSRISFRTIQVLPELIGRPWNKEALSYVHGLRPSYIRVVLGEQTTDAIHWRVTVGVDEDGRITGIEQEVEIALE